MSALRNNTEVENLFCLPLFLGEDFIHELIVLKADTGSPHMWKRYGLFDGGNILKSVGLRLHEKRVGLESISSSVQRHGITPA
jgi:hypothetical protein